MVRMMRFCTSIEEMRDALFCFDRLDFSLLNFFALTVISGGQWDLASISCACWVFEHVLALFEAFPNTKSVLGVMLCFKLHFCPMLKKRVFGPFYPLWRPQNCVLVPVDGAFWVPLEPQIYTKMAKKGSQGAGKPQLVSKTFWEYLGNHSPTFEK